MLLPELLKTAGGGPAATEMVGNLFCSAAELLQLCSGQWQPIIGAGLQPFQHEVLCTALLHDHIALHTSEDGPPHSP